MEYKYHVLKCAWPGVEDLLLDVNCGIRDLAAYILKKHSQLDILAFYEKHLKEPVPVPAILGIGEQGRALDDMDWRTLFFRIWSTNLKRWSGALWKPWIC